MILETSAILGEQAGLSIDTLSRNALITNATAAYSGGASAITDISLADHEFNYEDILKQYFTLQANNARPIGGSFIIVTHPYSVGSLFKDPVFVNMFNNETDENKIRSGKIGRILNCDIYVSSNSYESANAGKSGTTDVYSALFLGDESFGRAGMSTLMPGNLDSGGVDEWTNTGKQVRPVNLIVKDLDSGGSDDPLNQRGSIGWKVSHDLEVLNSDWIINLYHANMASDD